MDKIKNFLYATLYVFGSYITILSIVLFDNYKLKDMQINFSKIRKTKKYKNFKSILLEE